MAINKKTIAAGFGTVLAAMGAWFYKVAITEPVTDCYPNICPPTSSEQSKKEEVLLDGTVVPAAKPEPELSWYEWAKSYIPSMPTFKTETKSSKEKDTNDIIMEQFRGP